MVLIKRISPSTNIDTTQFIWLVKQLHVPGIHLFPLRIRTYLVCNSWTVGTKTIQVTIQISHIKPQTHF